MQCVGTNLKKEINDQSKKWFKEQKKKEIIVSIHNDSSHTT